MDNDTLIVDCQIFQTPAWDRGMGKYSLSLLKYLFKTQLKHKNQMLLFSRNLPTPEVMLDEIANLLPNAEIIWLNLKPSTHHSIEKQASKNKKVIDSFINKKGYKTDFLMLSSFQKPICPVFPTFARKFLVFYDAIPLLYHKTYQPDDNYLSRLAVVFEAHHIFTISKTVRDDLAVHLGLTDTTTINIDGGPIEREHLIATPPNVKLPDKFILMPTGDDLRKNNLRGVKAFEKFRRNNPSVKLVLTSKFEPNLRLELERYSKHLVFTGNINEAELAWLYSNAMFLLFPSEYEGLGLPVLEAVRQRKIVVCSDIPVFKEMSKDAFCYFDPFDESSITEALYVAAKAEVADKADEYDRLTSRYTWAKTAETVGKELNKNNGQEVIKKPKLAVFAPLPSGYSAIGKVAVELHPALSKKFDITYYFEAGMSGGSNLRPNYMPYLAPVYNARAFNSTHYKNYDAVLYHIGNSEYHIEAIKNALYLPGYIILHDTYLDGVYNEIRAAGYISQARLIAEAHLNELLAAKSGSFLASIINAQKGVITHSEFARSAAGEVLQKQVPITKLQLPVATPEQNVQEQEHKHLRIGLAGILTERKGIDIIERVASMSEFSNCVIDIFGFNYTGSKIPKNVAKYKNVTINTNLSDFDYQSRLAQLDVMINYRYEYRGETSLSALEAMRYGSAVMVKGDIGWFAELPDDTVEKTTSVDDLISKLKDLINSADKRYALGSTAKSYTAKEHSQEKYAQGIASLISKPLE